VSEVHKNIHREGERKRHTHRDRDIDIDIDRARSKRDAAIHRGTERRTDAGMASDNRTNQ